jgi:hypothetical protein
MTEGMSLRIILTAVCLQTLCNSFPRFMSGLVPSSSSVTTLRKDFNFNNEYSNSFISFCTSINRADAQQEIDKKKEKGKKPQRFIHPQVRRKS